LKLDVELRLEIFFVLIRLPNGEQRGQSTNGQIKPLNQDGTSPLGILSN